MHQQGIRLPTFGRIGLGGGGSGGGMSSSDDDVSKSDKEVKDMRGNPEMNTNSSNIRLDRNSSLHMK